jgi:hypothetical protein
MVKNQVYRVTEAEMRELKENLAKDNTMFIVEIDGNELKTEKDFFSKMWAIFNFPPAERPSWDGFLDWIEDSFYYKGEHFTLIIYNYEHLFALDKAAKTTWISVLFNNLLLHWESEVKWVARMPTKKYNVYLVDDLPALPPWERPGWR